MIHQLLFKLFFVYIYYPFTNMRGYFHYIPSNVCSFKCKGRHKILSNLGSKITTTMHGVKR